MHVCSQQTKSLVRSGLEREQFSSNRQRGREAFGVRRFTAAFRTRWSVCPTQSGAEAPQSPAAAHTRQPTGRSRVVPGSCTVGVRISVGLGRRVCALRESAVLEPAPDTHLSAIVHRGRAGTAFPLTPALSPRRGRPFDRPRSIRASSVFGHLIHLPIPTAARGRGLLGWPESGRGFSLSPRERVGVRGPCPVSCGPLNNSL